MPILFQNGGKSKKEERKERKTERKAERASKPRSNSEWEAYTLGNAQELKDLGYVYEHDPYGNYRFVHRETGDVYRGPTTVGMGIGEANKLFPKNKREKRAAAEGMQYLISSGFFESKSQADKAAADRTASSQLGMEEGIQRLVSKNNSDIETENTKYDNTSHKEIVGEADAYMESMPEPIDYKPPTPTATQVWERIERKNSNDPLNEGFIGPTEYEEDFFITKDGKKVSKAGQKEYEQSLIPKADNDETIYDNIEASKPKPPTEYQKYMDMEVLPSWVPKWEPGSKGDIASYLTTPIYATHKYNEWFLKNLNYLWNYPRRQGYDGWGGYLNNGAKREE